MKCGDPNNPAGPGLTVHGVPCQHNLTLGFVRCAVHGGGNPASIIKAEQAMAQARLPAIEALFTILEQFSTSTCGACGFPRGDADEKRMIIQACRVVLDRAGMGPRAIIELTTQSDGDINIELLSDDERARLLGYLAQIRAIKDVIRLRQVGGIVPEPIETETVDAASESQRSSEVVQNVASEPQRSSEVIQKPQRWRDPVQDASFAGPDALPGQDEASPDPATEHLVDERPPDESVIEVASPDPARIADLTQRGDTGIAARIADRFAQARQEAAAQAQAEQDAARRAQAEEDAQDAALQAQAKDALLNWWK